eukprot:jgi/Tetstr1/428463/TSEL_018474.t1
MRLTMAFTSPIALLRAIRLRTIVIYLTESEFDPSELLIHPFSQTVREHRWWHPRHRENMTVAQDSVNGVREDQGRANSGTNREAPCRHIASPITTRPEPTATSSDPSSPDHPPADDEEELELNYEENESAMESSLASQPAIAAELASLTAESHQMRSPQRLSIQLKRHPSQPAPAGNGKAATTAKHKKKQPKGRSRSDGATRNRSRSKALLSGTRGSSNEWKTDDDAAHPSSSSHQ